MSKVLYKPDLVEKIINVTDTYPENLRLTKAQAKSALDAFQTVLLDFLKNAEEGDKVVLVGLGAFTKSKTKTKTLNANFSSFKAKEGETVGGYNVLRFKTASAIKRSKTRKQQAE